MSRIEAIKVALGNKCGVRLENEAYTFGHMTPHAQESPSPPKDLDPGRGPPPSHPLHNVSGLRACGSHKELCCHESLCRSSHAALCPGKYPAMPEAPHSTDGTMTATPLPCGGSNRSGWLAEPSSLSRGEGEWFSRCR